MAAKNSVRSALDGDPWHGHITWFPPIKARTLHHFKVMTLFISQSCLTPLECAHLCQYVAVSALTRSPALAQGISMASRNLCLYLHVVVPALFMGPALAQGISMASRQPAGWLTEGKLVKWWVGGNKCQPTNTTVSLPFLVMLQRVSRSY